MSPESLRNLAKSRYQPLDQMNRYLWLAMGALLLSGCAIRPITPPLEKVDPDAGYRWSNRAPLPDNDPATLLVFSFSGGGTRAAAFSYGVLEELQRTPVGRPGDVHTMLSEADVVTGVSGGSFTALTFGLLGDRIFERYETDFLKRDVEAELIKRLLNPIYWPRTLSSGFGRSELAEDYYDEILFHGARFGDLVGRSTPLILVSATAISTGTEWVFSQRYFDAICSDLSQMQLARAAAASSAVPVIMSPVTLNNYGGRCGYRMPKLLSSSLAPGAWPRTRIQQQARDLARYTDGEKRPYLHLVDGGLVDNLGLYAFVGELQELADSAGFRQAIRAGALRRIAVVVVNARSADDFNYDQRQQPPSTLELLLQSSSVPIDRFSSEAVYALEDIVKQWQLERQLGNDERRLKVTVSAADDVPPIDFSIINVSFDALADEAERDYLLNLPTSLFLESAAVDRLRAAAATVLRNSAPYQKLVRDLSGGDAPAPAPGAAPY